MDFNAIEIIAKDGTAYTLRRAEAGDAAALLELLCVTAEQTRFLLREPDEVTMTVEQEQDFIQRYAEDPKALLLLVERAGRCVGLCSVSSAGPFCRYAHRCGVAIALHKNVWGLGLGRVAMETLLMEAKKAGYKQAELDVVVDNHRAVALYESLGFVRYGTLPRNMQYADGTYADAAWMMKEL